MALVPIGKVTEFPPNIFWSDNRPGIGALVAGRDPAQPGPPDRANRWFRIEFSPGAGYDDVGTARARPVEGGPQGDPTNGGTLGSWAPIIARKTKFTSANLPAIIGAEVDANGDVYIEESKALDATGRGRYGSYSPSGATTTTTTAGPPLPPGPEGYTGGAAATDGPPLVEFSIDDTGEGNWVAKTPQTSAAGKDGNPHRGISIINPGAWEKVAGGLSVREALSLDEYESRGWKGLYSRRFLAWQEDGSVQPAGEELSQAMDRAEKGDQGAYRALRAVGVTYEGAPPERKPSDILESFGL